MIHPVLSSRLIPNIWGVLTLQQPPARPLVWLNCAKGQPHSWHPPEKRETGHKDMPVGEWEKASKSSEPLAILRRDIFCASDMFCFVLSVCLLCLVTHSYSSSAYPLSLLTHLKLLEPQCLWQQSLHTYCLKNHFSFVFSPASLWPIILVMEAASGLLLHEAMTLQVSTILPLFWDGELRTT